MKESSASEHSDELARAMERAFAAEDALGRLEGEASAMRSKLVFLEQVGERLSEEGLSLGGRMC